MAMTRKEFLASAASVGALSACAGKVIVLAAVAFLAFAGMCGERYWLPRANNLRIDTSANTPLVHSTGDVCKVVMGKKDVPDNNVHPLQMAMPPPVTTVASTNMTNTVASVTKGN